MKKQREEEREKKERQANPEETSQAEHKECEKTDKKSCEEGKDCQKEHSGCAEGKECNELKEKIEALEKEKKSAEEKLAKEKDDYIRLMAEFETFRRRTGLIYDKLMKYLKTKGLEKIDAKGKKFDTDFHEAVAQVPVADKDKKGMVYDVIETGYTLGGKILRYAKVVVGI